MRDSLPVNAGRRYFAAADVLRILCIFTVAWFHIWQQSWLDPSFRIAGHYFDLQRIVRRGYMLVDLTLLLTGCMLLMGVKDQMHKIDRSTLPEWVLLVVWSTGCILTLLIAPGWLNDYLAPLAAKAANTLLPIGHVALIVEMFRAQRVYLQTEEQ